jgi:DNA-binding MarR family transcriptional regulator
MTKYSPDSNSKRPLPLEQTVRRMVESLANVSAKAVPEHGDSPSGTEEPEISQQVIHRVICAWHARACYVPAELLSDPAWGMLLELFHGELAGQRLSLSTVCDAAGAPVSTAMRWLKALESKGLVIRRPDPGDAEIEFIELTSTGSAAFRRYFRDVLSNG